MQVSVSLHRPVAFAFGVARVRSSERLPCAVSETREGIKQTEWWQPLRAADK